MQKAKTIAFVANTSWYLWNFRKSSILKALALGYSVIVIAPCDDKYVKLLEKLGCRSFNVKLDATGVNPFKELLSLRRVVRVLRILKPVAVFSFTPKCNIYFAISCRFLGIKCFPNVSGLGVFNGGNVILSLVLRVLYKIAFFKCEHLFFQNHEDLGIFNNLKIASSVSKSVVPGSGVDLELFSPRAKRFDGKIKFVFIGRLLYEKGIGDYISAAGVIRREFGNDAEFDVYGVAQPGRGPELEELERFTREGTISFKGESDSISQVLGDYHCIVLPSFYGEGVPKSLIEAAASGLAVITTDNVGCREVVSADNGFMFPPKDIRALAECIRKYLLLSNEEKSAMSVYSRYLAVSKYDEKFVIESYFDKLKESLE